MNIKEFISKNKHLGYIILFSAIILLCLWAFIYAGIITQSFKTKIQDKTYNNQEANIENLLVTETKDGQKLWEMYAEIGVYSDNNNVVYLEDIVGNVYEYDKVKASFRSDRGTYNSKTKEIIMLGNVLLVNKDGTNIIADRIEYKGKDEDIVATGSVRVEKPGEAVVYGSKGVLKGDFSDFHIEGRTKTVFYMK